MNKIAILIRIKVSPLIVCYSLQQLTLMRVLRPEMFPMVLMATDSLGS